MDGVEASAGSREAAARLARAAAAVYERVGAPPELLEQAPRDRYVVRLRQALGREGAHGRAMNLDEALAETLA